MKNLQKRLFSHIRSNHKDAVSQIADILYLSPSAVYKRIQGRTALTAEEMARIATHFEVSIDDFIVTGRSGAIIELPDLALPIRSYMDYLVPIAQDLGGMVEMPDLKIYYASREIPTFFFSFFKEIFAFQFFFWGKTTWQLPDLENQKFSLELSDADNKAYHFSRDILLHYLETSTIEFWSSGVIQHFLQEINYAIDHQWFEHLDDAIAIQEKLLELSRHLCDMATAGKKFFPGNEPQIKQGDFQLFLHEALINENTILVETGTLLLAYKPLNNPNYFKTVEPVVCEATKRMFDQLERRAVPISKTNERERLRFFDLNQKAILASIEKLKNL